jgi:hypothetical protein
MPIRSGAYIRVLQRPKGGCVVVMTLPILAGQDAEKVAAILSQELTALVNLSENTDGCAARQTGVTSVAKKRRPEVILLRRESAPVHLILRQNIPGLWEIRDEGSGAA